jgi:hypothetical protein
MIAAAPSAADRVADRHPALNFVARVHRRRGALVAWFAVQLLIDEAQ